MMLKAKLHSVQGNYMLLLIYPKNICLTRGSSVLSFGVSIGKSVYFNIDLTDYLLWRSPSGWSVFVTLKGGDNNLAVGRPQQLNSG